MTTYYSSLPIAAVQGQGGAVSLKDLLTSAFGTGLGGYSSFDISYQNSDYMYAKGWGYWGNGPGVVSSWSVNGYDIGGGHPVTVSANDIASADLHIGNNMPPLEYITVKINDTDTIQYSVYTVRPELAVGADHVGKPVAADIVAAALKFAEAYKLQFDGPRDIDCSFIARDIAAAAGAVFPEGNFVSPHIDNDMGYDEGGFWRKVYDGSKGNPVEHWQDLAQPGDIITMSWKAPGGGISSLGHAITVVARNADGSLQVVDNGAWDGHGYDGIGLSTFNAQDLTAASTVSIFRLASDHTYLINHLASTKGEQLVGSQFDDRILAGSGDDVIVSTAGNDRIDGGGGNNTVDYSYTLGVKAWLYDQSAFGGGDVGQDILINIRNLIGSKYDDTLVGDDKDNKLDGNDGADILVGWGGNDTLNGGSGGDTLNGGAGNDTLFGGSGKDTLNGGTENDKLDPGLDGDTDTVDGGDGFDTLDYSATKNGVTVHLSAFHTLQGALDLTWTARATGSEIGTDLLTSIEKVIGGSGNDYLYGDGYDNTFVGGKGDDYIFGGGGKDTVDYSDTTKGVVVSLGDNYIPGTGFNGFWHNEAVGAEIGHDTLDSIETVIGGKGNDILYGNALDNTFVGGLGKNTINGGAGHDTVDYNWASGDQGAFWSVNVDLTKGTAVGSGFEDRLTSIENVIGTRNMDTFIGNADDNIFTGLGGGVGFFGTGDLFSGGDGNDTVDYSWTWKGVQAALPQTNHLSSGPAPTMAAGAEIGSDRFYSIENLIGGHGDDQFWGNEAANVLVGGDGADKLYGGWGNDRLIGGAGNDILDGGEDTDTVDYSATTQGVTVHLDNWRVQSGGLLSLILQSPRATGAEIGTDTLVSIENAIGGAGDDIIYGTAGKNRLEAGGGTKNELHGGGDDDVLVGGSGNDLLDGGTGTNTVDYSVDTRGITVHLDTWRKIVLSTDWFGYAFSADVAPEASGKGIGVDQLQSIQNVTGGAGNDKIYGSFEANWLDGGRGNDVLQGGTGGDTLVGGAGADMMYANTSGAQGNDGARDTFKFNAITDSGTTAGTIDEIFGFAATHNAAGDVLDFRSFDVNPATLAIDHLVFGNTALPGHINFQYSGADTIVLVNGNSDAAVDMQIIVHNAHLTTNDFLL